MTWLLIGCDALLVVAVLLAWLAVGGLRSEVARQHRENAEEFRAALERERERREHLAGLVNVERARADKAQEFAEAAIADAQQERATAREERKELYTRIQAYDPTPPQAPPEPGSQQPEEENDFEGLTLSELTDLGLKPNSGGGFLDTYSGEVWDSIEDVKEFRAVLKKRGLPLSTPLSEIL